jgi:CheY-like chemotaxis protein
VIREKEVVEITVKDTGIGIKSEDYRQIFQDNANISLGESYNKQGSGLGLSICKNLANNLHYKLGFKSIYGKGSKFFIRIKFNYYHEKRRSSVSLNKIKHPKLNKLDESKNIKTLKEFIRRNEKVIKSEKEKLEINEIILDSIKSERYLKYNTHISEEEKFKIVVVDDQKLVRQTTINLLMSILKNNGIPNYKVIECCDGIDLLSLIKDDFKGMIKLVFIDENMDYLNGSETVKIIRKLETDKKINYYPLISITGMSDLETNDLMLRYGYDLVISKPCSKSDLKKALKMFANFDKNY